MKTPRPISFVETYVPRQHGRSFLWHVREARRIGALPRAFRERELRRACPGWAWRTYFKFPDRHPELFVRGPGRHYWLVEEQVSPGGCIRSR